METECLRTVETGRGDKIKPEFITDEAKYVFVTWKNRRAERNVQGCASLVRAANKRREYVLRCTRTEGHTALAVTNATQITGSCLSAHDAGPPPPKTGFRTSRYRGRRGQVQDGRPHIT